MVVEGVNPAAIVFPLFNVIIRGVQEAYEFAAVSAETNDCLRTIWQVLADLKVAKELRRQKANTLTTQNLTRVDEVIKNSEDAVRGLEQLVERARVDMSVDEDRVGAGARIM